MSRPTEGDPPVGQRNPRISERRAAIIALLDAGVPKRELTSRLQVSHQTIGRDLKALGRARGEHGNRGDVDRRRAEVLRLTRQGVTVDELPTRLSVSKATIATDLRMLRAAGEDEIPPARSPGPRRNDATARRRELVAELHGQGLSTREIADELRVGPKTIARDLATLINIGRLFGGPPPIASQFDNPVAHARVAAGFTAPALAQASGVAITAVLTAERGGRVHRDNALRLANALGVPLTQLWRELAQALPGQVREPRSAAKRRQTHQRRAAVARLRNEDLQAHQIATALGISRPTVYRDIAWLRENGWRIPPRPYGRPPNTT